MLVGQATTSPTRTSWWKYPSIAHFMGVVWLHTMALGSPVVPEENRMLQGWEADTGTMSNSSDESLNKSSHRQSTPGRNALSTLGWMV